MIVGDLRAQVAALTPADARMAAAQQQFLVALDRLPAPLDRHADPTHVTASAIVVSARGVLLHRHRRLGIWLQPGGHLDPDETPAQAAQREAREETGVDVRHPHGGPRLVHVDVHDVPNGHLHLDLRYLLLGSDAEPTPPSTESQAVRWFDWDEALAVADPGLVAALRALR